MKPGDHYCTPPSIVDLVNEVDSIALDPCSNKYSIVGAEIELRLEKGDDGLRTAWSPICKKLDGLWYCNPPYSGGQIGLWSRKACIEWSDGAPGIFLANVDTSAEWFRLCSRSAVSRAFPPRISFMLRGKLIDGNRAAQVLFYFGRDPERFATACRRLWEDCVEVEPLRRGLRRVA